MALTKGDAQKGTQGGQSSTLTSRNRMGFSAQRGSHSTIYCFWYLGSSNRYLTVPFRGSVNIVLQTLQRNIFSDAKNWRSLGKSGARESELDSGILLLRSIFIYIQSSLK